MASESQRAFIRKRITFTFEVTSVIRDGATLAVPSGPHFHGIEIGAGGMGFETQVPLMRGDQLSIRFTLPGETHLLCLSMQVMYLSVLTNRSQKGFMRVGGRFDRMDPSDHSYLSNYIGTTFILY